MFRPFPRANIQMGNYSTLSLSLSLYQVRYSTSPCYQARHSPIFPLNQTLFNFDVITLY